MDNQAFLSSEPNDEENFAALDSMNPTAFAQPKPTEPMSGSVSGSLFDRIRARTEEQQKAAAASAAANTTAVIAPSQQQASEPTMELEKSPPQKTAFDNAVNASTSGIPPQQQQQQQPSNETTYSFSGASDYSTHIPTYGPSRNQYTSDEQQYYYGNSIKDKASNALFTVWNGAQSAIGMVQDRFLNGGNNSGGESGYNTNFLLREDGLEGGGGGGAPSSSMASHPEGGGATAISFVSGKAYSMVSYGKTFCEDIFGFFMQLPHWGKGVVVIVLVLLVKFLFFW